MAPITAQKKKFSIKDFFSKCDQIRSAGSEQVIASCTDFLRNKSVNPNQPLQHRILISRGDKAL